MPSIDGDYARQHKMGMLVVALGIAARGDVFPDGYDARIELRSLPKQRPVVAWLPASFSKAPAVAAAPAVPDTTASSFAASAASAATASPLNEGTSLSEPPVPVPLAAATPAVVAPAATPRVAPAAAALRTRPRATEVHPQVAEAKANLLRTEGAIHELLQTIEDTREKYLQIAPPNAECERHVDAVARCYDHFNKHEARVASEGRMAKPGAASVLQCAPYVDLLVKCAARLADSVALSLGQDPSSGSS